MNATKPIRPSPSAKSAATELLGDAQRGGQISPSWQKHLSRLLNLRDHLLQQQRAQFDDAKAVLPNFSMHMADAGTDSYDRDLALSLLSHEQNAVYEIEEALNRIRNGTYGICEVTGREIPAERLDAVPWTRFSAEAETALEKKGDFQRAQLGTRETVGREGPPRKAEEEA